MFGAEELKNLKEVEKFECFADSSAYENSAFDNHLNNQGFNDFDHGPGSNIDKEGNLSGINSHVGTFDAEARSEDEGKEYKALRSQFAQCALAGQNPLSEFQSELSGMIGNMLRVDTPEAQEASDKLKGVVESSEENAALVNGFLPNAARDENGQIFATEHQKIEWESENLNVCTIYPTAESIVDSVNAGTAQAEIDHLNKVGAPLPALPGT